VEVDGTPIWSHGGIHEGDKVDEAALKDLIRAAVALNLKGKSKPKSGRASSKRAD
jgi:hypothetical protein